MAAEQKAVESTAEEILQREDHLETESHSARDQREDLSVRAVKESHSERERASVTDHADHSARAARDVLSVRDQREELSARALKEDLSVVTDHADHSQRVATESHSERDQKEDHSVKDQREEALARAEKEEREEASATESQADSE